ncbi:MAG: hypothetical protein D6726_10705 [Nitrospirae bacterium]|nr:MAG: hypothetical protein D6726_10705 [Nitrospirota bacterium]
MLDNTLILVKKDILLEIRSRESLSIMVFLSLLFLVIFNVSIEIDKKDISELASGIIWVIFAFSGIVGMGKTAHSEKEDDAYMNILFSETNLVNLYTAKLISNIILLLLMEMFTILAFTVLFNYNAFITNMHKLVIPLVLGTIGFSAVGTLFSFITSGSRYGDTLLPFLFLPVVVPVIIGSVNATSIILKASEYENPLRWYKILGVFDVLYVSVSTMLFKFTLKE